MALIEDDLEALRSLIREEVRGEIEPFRKEVNARFDTVQGQILELFERDDDRQKEYVVIKGQLDRHDQEFIKLGKQLDRIEKKVDRHDQYFDDLDSRVAALEQKRA